MATYPTFKARLVMGSPFQLQTTDFENKTLKESSQYWFCGFAIPKGPEWDALHAVMKQEAEGDPSCTAALCNQGGFKWKFEDCDAPDTPANKGKDTYPAGHMLLKMTRNVAMGQPPVINNAYQPLTDKDIKRGDYFFVNGSTRFNGRTSVNSNAGMYQNVEFLLFAESGPAMASAAPAVDPRAIFASVIDQAKPTTAVTPAHDLVKTPVAPPAPPAMNPNPAPAPKTFNVGGTEYTNEALLAAGWSQAQIDAL